MLKKVLLNTGYFVDNSYLDEYLELIQKPFSFSGYSERHHVIPAVVYSIKYSIKDNCEARKKANADPNNFLIDLLFKDHCKAHWLLYNCTLDEVKACNARAYILMSGKKVTQLEELSSEEYDEIQLHRDLVIEETDYYWSIEEKQLLADCYANKSFEELTAMFNRSRKAIIRTANALGLTRRLWSTEDEAWLIENYGKYSRKECAEYLGKTEASINKKCTTLQLKKKQIHAGRRFKWSTEAEQWLLENYSVLGIHECAKYLKVSDSAISHKYSRLKGNN